VGITCRMRTFIEPGTYSCGDPRPRRYCATPWHPSTAVGRQAPDQRGQGGRPGRYTLLVVAAVLVATSLVVLLGASLLIAASATEGRMATALRLAAVAAILLGVVGGCAAAIVARAARVRLATADRRYGSLSAAARTTMQMSTDFERFADHQTELGRRLDELGNQIQRLNDTTAVRFAPLVEAVEGARSDSIRLLSQLDELRGSVIDESALDRHLGAAVQASQYATDRAIATVGRRTQDLMSLHAMLKPHAGFPLPNEWEISPSFGAFVVDLVIEKRPSQVLALGGRVLPLLVALALERNGAGMVAVLEDDPSNSQAVQHFLERFGVETRATVFERPLAHVSIEEHECSWYAIDPAELDLIDLVVVGGAPHGPEVFPAVPVLETRLRDGAFVVLDDAADMDRQAAADRWCDSYGLEAEMFLQLEPLAVVLRKVRNEVRDAAAS
jgi:hypothetical protein